MSEDLFKAVYTRYTAAPANDFFTATGGRLEYSRAPEGWSDNFAVMQAIDLGRDDMFRVNIDDLLFQVNVFSTVRATCWGLLAKCETLFDRVTLTIANHYPSMVRRWNKVPPIWNEEDNLWQATIAFAVKLQKSS